MMESKNLYVVVVNRSTSSASTVDEIRAAAAGEWPIDRAAPAPAKGDIVLASRRGKIVGAYEVDSMTLEMSSGKWTAELVEASDPWSWTVGQQSPLPGVPGAMQPVRCIPASEIRHRIQPRPPQQNLNVADFTLRVTGATATLVAPAGATVIVKTLPNDSGVA